MKKDKTAFTWFVPMPYQKEQAKREFRAAFPPAAIVRIVLAVTAVFIALAYALGRRFPEMEFDWVRAFFQCMAALVLILLGCAFIAFVPPIVYVKSNGIAIQQGQTFRFYPYSQILELRIEEPADSPSQYPTLVFLLQSQHEPKRYPISRRINPDELRKFINANRSRFLGV